MAALSIVRTSDSFTHNGIAFTACAVLVEGIDTFTAVVNLRRPGWCATYTAVLTDEAFDRHEFVVLTSTDGLVDGRVLGSVEIGGGRKAWEAAYRSTLRTFGREVVFAQM